MNSKFLYAVFNKKFKRLELVIGQNFRISFLVTLIINFTSGSTKPWVIWWSWISGQKFPASLIGKKNLLFITNFTAKICPNDIKLGIFYSKKDIKTIGEKFAWAKRSTQKYHRRNFKFQLKKVSVSCSKYLKESLPFSVTSRRHQ